MKELIKRLETFKKVEQLQANQFVVLFDNGKIFQSYDSIIAIQLFNDKVYLTDKWNYSKTTSKYLYEFLREYTLFNVKCKKDVERLIKEGYFELI